jgi:hypothetical protein
MPGPIVHEKPVKGVCAAGKCYVGSRGKANGTVVYHVGERSKIIVGNRRKKGESRLYIITQMNQSWRRYQWPEKKR